MATRRERRERWVREHHAAVYRAAFRVLRDEGLALDAAQRAFVRALERPEEQVTDPRGLLCWLSTRLALQELRSERSRRTREAAFARGSARGTTGTEASVDDLAAAREEREAVARSVASLPDDLRIPLELRYAESMTFAAIAELVECSEPTAHDRVRRALEQLRARLKRAGFAVAMAPLEAHLTRPPSIPTPPGLEAALLDGTATVAAATTTKAAVAAALVGLTLTSVALLTADPVPASTPAAPRVAEATLGDRIPSPPISPARALETASAASVGPADASRRPVPPPADPPRAAQVLVQQVGQIDGIAGVATLRGRVVGPNEDLRARLEVVARGAEWVKGSPAAARAAVASDGSFEIEVPTWLEDGRYVRLDLEYEGAVVTRGAERKVAADEVTELELRLGHDLGERAGAFTLDLVLTEASGAPLAATPVELRRRIQGATRAFEVTEATGTTDGAGRLRLTGERLGEKVLRIGGVRREGVAPPIERTLQIAAAGPAFAAFTLPASDRIAGRVCDEAGAALADATLTIDGAAVALDASGTFDAGPFARSGHALVASAPGHATRRVEEWAPGAEPILLRLANDGEDEARLEVAGRFFDLVTSGPMPMEWWAGDVDLLPVPDELDGVALLADFLPNHLRATPVQRSARAEAPPPTDRFATRAYHPGRVLAVARASDRAPAIAGPFDLRETPIVTDVVMRFDAAAAVTGTVRAPDGGEVSGAVVMVTGAGPISGRCLADADDLVRRAGGRGFLPFADARSGKGGSFAVGELPHHLSLRLAVLHPAFEPRVSAPLALRPGQVTEGVTLTLGPRRVR